MPPRQTTQPSHVSHEDVLHEIVYEAYFTAADGIQMAMVPGATSATSVALGCDQVTICVIVTRNATKLVGVNTGPVNAASFDPELGRELARRDALEQLWPMLGYQLRTRLQAEHRPT